MHVGGGLSNGPLAVSKVTVTLVHFLDVADVIVKGVDAIGTLDVQAHVCVWGWGWGGGRELSETPSQVQREGWV